MIADAIRRVRLSFARRRLIAHAMREYGWTRRRASIYVDAIADAHIAIMAARSKRP